MNSRRSSRRNPSAGQAAHRRRRPLLVEALEARQLLSSVSVANHALLIEGTSGNDTITVAVDPLVRGMLRVSINGRQNQIDATGLRRINISALEGDDLVFIDQSQGQIRLPINVAGGSGNDTITGGSGSDVLQGGRGNDLISGGASGDVVEGDAGNDTLFGGDGTINSIYAEGYGIRGNTIDGGALLNSMRTDPKVRNVSTLEYTPSVRQSERFNIDPFFDQEPNAETDLHMYLGTSARRPRIKHVTDTGVIADTLATANRNAGSVVANQIRASQFNFANTISSIRTGGVIDSLSLTTGRLKSFVSGDSAFGLNFSVAGTIDSFRVVGDVDDTSRIQALGPSARIIDFIVDGTMNGDVSSANNLHQLLIGKDLGAPALVKAKTLDIQRIRGNIFGTIQIG
jgi:RTX calcium-binding nonapeptide repeat (4 copies)